VYVNSEVHTGDTGDGNYTNMDGDTDDGSHVNSEGHTGDTGDGNYTNMDGDTEDGSHVNSEVPVCPLSV
jgi:hypothetical protein